MAVFTSLLIMSKKWDALTDSTDMWLFCGQRGTSLLQLTLCHLLRPSAFYTSPFFCVSKSIICRNLMKQALVCFSFFCLLSKRFLWDFILQKLGKNFPLPDAFSASGGRIPEQELRIKICCPIHIPSDRYDFCSSY